MAPMAIRVEVEGQNGVVLLTGLDRLLALRTRVRFDAQHIVAATVMALRSVPRTPGTWLRLPGTYIPGLVRYGSYGRGKRREFWAAFRQRQVLVIDLRGSEYARLVLATHRPDSDVMLLTGVHRGA